MLTLYIVGRISRSAWCHYRYYRFTYNRCRIQGQREWLHMDRIVLHARSSRYVFIQSKSENNGDLTHSAYSNHAVLG